MIKAKYVQMIFLSDTESYLFLQEIRFDSSNKGRIRFNGNPVKLLREESFLIEGEEVITEQYHFPIAYLSNWLHLNKCIDEKGQIKNIGFYD